MIFSLSIIYSLLAILPLLLLAFVAIFLIIVPYFKVSAYNKPDIETFFFPVLGFYQYVTKNLKQYDDILAGAKIGHSCKTKALVSHIGGGTYMVLRDPQYVKEFLSKQASGLYNKSRILDSFRALTATGLLVAEGDVWKRNRRIISNSFHFEFMKGNLSLIQNTAREFLDPMTSSELKAFPITKKIKEITGEVVGRIFFGENLGKYQFEGKPLTLALDDVATEVSLAGRTFLVLIFGGKALRSPLIPRHRRIMKRIQDFRQVCFNIINDRKAKPIQSNDLLGSLLATQKLEDPDMRYSDEEIVNDFIMFFVGGMDTTAHMIGMTLYNLAQHPEHLRRLEEERQANYEKGVTTESLHKMDFLHSVIKESLRFYTPGPFLFSRKALQDHKIQDLEIKKGSMISCEVLSAHFDEKYYPEPQKFNPERWTESNAKTEPYAFLPFSAGPRNCIGQHLAMIEAKVIISEFLKRFDFKVTDGYKLKMVFKFVYEPEKDVLLDLKPRASSK